MSFSVDMAGYDGSYGMVNLNGSFNGWCGDCTPMSDDDGDGVYEVTVALPLGTIEYKFTVDGWTDQENFTPGDACTSTIDGFTNRTHDVAGSSALDVVCWESCEACPTQGCTDPAFAEFDPYAGIDDGSCQNLVVAGCVYEAATNFNPLANDDDGSCEFEDGGNNDCPADLDQDGTVATADLLLFLSGFGQSCN